MSEIVPYVIAPRFYSLTRIKRESLKRALIALLPSTLQAGVSNALTQLSKDKGDSAGGVLALTIGGALPN